MNVHLQRALLLFDQSRTDLAEAELRQALTDEPGDALAHALLALCLARREQFKEATEESQQAIQLSPDLPFAHYALASILQDRQRPTEALAAIQEALRLDASDPDYYALLSGIHLSERRWPAALEAAEMGLRLNSEHVGCTNLRAIALVKLGRKAEAGLTIQAALAKNPEDALSHANQGWTLLEQSDPKKALEHFRESLRLDPENEWARQGIVEALKAQHFVYAWMLRYFLWMSRLSSSAQWGILLGGYFGNRLLGTLAEKNPDLAPWLLPVRILYVLFALLTWTADPLFNLLLRLNRFGRLVLTREQVVASNWIGGCLLLALVCLGVAFLTHLAVPMVLAAAVFGFLILPLAGTFKCHTGWPRTAMGLYTGGMALIGLLALAQVLQAAGGNLTTHSVPRSAASLFSLFLLAAIASGWVANILITQRPRR
jgi:tetratricopeptide (TPR) repeat protein